MFRNVTPIFKRKYVLKKEMLENLRDYPRTLFHIQYQEYSDGILYGCRLEAADTKLTVLPGIILFQGLCLCSASHSASKLRSNAS